MTEGNSSFSRFSQIVLDDASSERTRILEDLEARRTKVLRDAETAAAQKMRQTIQNETVRLEAEAGRELSRHMLENNRRITTLRQSISAEVFNTVRERLLQWNQTPEYREALGKLYCKAFETLGNPWDAVIYLRPEDLSLDSDLARLLPGRHVEFREGAITLGGLIMDCRSRMLRVDLSYDTALDDLNGHFAELFGLRLSDEDEQERSDHL